jgi:hypothetical protein
MAVDKIIPERSVESLWEDGVRNVGVWYFYLKNYFATSIKESKLDVTAREKGLETLNRFLGYIKDGRVGEKDVVELSDKINFLDPSESALSRMDEKDIKEAVNKMNHINDRLEKEGPGSPLDPVAEFKRLVERIKKITGKYKKE